MNVQVLIIRPEEQQHTRSPWDAQTLGLAVSEFPGLVRAGQVEDIARGIREAILLWSDREALERFRRSEVYAKLMLSPSVAELTDCAVEFPDVENIVGERAPTRARAA